MPDHNEMQKRLPDDLYLQTHGRGIRPPGKSRTPAELEELQRKLHEQHDVEQAAAKVLKEQHLENEVILKKTEAAVPTNNDVVWIDETIANQLAAQGAGSVLDKAPATPAQKNLLVMDEAFRAMTPKDQAEVNQVSERIKYLLVKYGQNAKFAIIYEGVKIAASEGQ